MSTWLHLVDAEFFKLKRLVVTRAVALAILLGPAVIVGALRLATTDVNTIVEDPGDIVLVSVVLLAGVGVLVLAASVFGQEYDLGTGRVLLMSGAPRFGVIVAKTAALLVVVACVGVAASGLGALAMRAVAWEPSLAEVAVLLARAGGLVLLVGLSYVGAAAIGAILGRSTSAGTLTGLGLFLGDFLLGTTRTQFPLSEWLPVSNLFTMAGVFESAIVDAQPLSPGGSMLRLLSLGTGLLLGSALLFHRQDVTR